MRILAINGGSSSFKSRLDDLPTGPLSIQPPKPLWHDQFELKGSVSESLAPVLKTVPGPIDAVGHRIVDGGGKFRQATPLTPEVRAAILAQAEERSKMNMTGSPSFAATADWQTMLL